MSQKNPEELASMRVQASFGAFLHITSFDVSDWHHQMIALKQLPNRRHVEVWFEWLPESSGELRIIRDLLRDECILIHAPFVGVSIASPWEDLSKISVDRILRTCDLASELGAELVTIHTGHVPFFDPTEMVLERIAQKYEYLCGHAGDITLAIENMHTTKGVTVHRGAAIRDLMALSELLADVSFTLDVGHAIQNGEEYCEFVNTCASSIVNIHLHDGYFGGAAHLRLGTAQLDLEALLRCCTAANYDRYISMETITAEDTLASWEILQRTIGILDM